MTIDDGPKYIKPTSSNSLINIIGAVSPLPLEYYLAPGYQNNPIIILSFLIVIIIRYGDVEVTVKNPLTTSIIVSLNGGSTTTLSSGASAVFSLLVYVYASTESQTVTFTFTVLQNLIINVINDVNKFNNRCLDSEVSQ